MAQNQGSQSSRYGIDNLTYDLVTVLHEKSKGLEAFEQYLRDAEGDNEARQCFEQLRQQDQENVQKLQRLLASRLASQGGRGERAA
jgi:hypothetical protein